MQTKDNLEAWRVFVSVARTGSIKETAIEQNLDMSAASRLLSSLETDLGFPFFDRHSRPMALTERGQSLVHHAEQLLAYFSQVNEIARSLSGNAVRYKLCYPLNVGRSNLIEQLNDYKKIDPLLEFDLMSECDHEDVLSGRVDIALLPYRPPSKGLVMWSVGKGLNFPLATPAYLKRHGTPRSRKTSQTTISFSAPGATTRPPTSSPAGMRKRLSSRSTWCLRVTPSPARPL